MRNVDTAVLILLGCASVLYVVLSLSPRPERGQVRVAYLGYAVCALVVALFQLHLYVEGPDTFMMFGIFLFPIAIAAGIAIINTVGARSATLRILGGATLALALFQILTFIDVMGAFMNVIARAYVILVLFACIYCRREWWPQSKQHDA
jgi:hypothetical protein